MAGDHVVQDRAKQVLEKWKSFKALLARRQQDMEEVVIAFFQCIPGFQVQGKDEESGRFDLVFWNEGTDPIGQELDRVIIVECKAGNRPAGADAVDRMEGLLISRGLDSGVVVSASGFTPEARNQARQALRQNGPKILLLNAADFRTVSSVEDARGILKRSYTDLYLA